MIYGAPVFLNAIWLLPPPLPLSLDSKLDRRYTGRERGGGRGWRRAKSYNGEKARSSINHTYSLEKTPTYVKCANAAFFTFQCGERRLELLDILESGQ
jgi:hypothetical protein